MAPLRLLPDMALSLQSEIYCAIYTLWTDEAGDARCRGWLAEQMQRIEAVSMSQYLGDSDFTARKAKFLADANWQQIGRAHV